MKPYNTFTEQERNDAQKWLNQQWASGALTKPFKCDVCGQEEGIIDAHAEDYRKPFGEHTDRYHLCFTCHMVVHCRFSNKQMWNEYRANIERGMRYAPFHKRDWPSFQQQFLRGVPFSRGFTAHKYNPRYTLDDIVKDGERVLRLLKRSAG